MTVKIPLSDFQPRNTALRRIFHAIVTNAHSPRTASNPHSRNCRNRITALMIPNTGSTVCLRSPYRARPARVFSACFMRRTASASSANGAGSVKRSCHGR